MEHHEESEPRLPLGSVLPDIKIHANDEPVDFVFVLAKTGSNAADAGWSYRTSSAPNREELLGALMVQVALFKKEIVDAWE